MESKGMWRRFKCVGLTGGISSGKSAVSRYLLSHYKDFILLDLDVIAKEILQPGKLAYWLITRKFGKSILDSSTGILDRKLLRELISKDHQARRYVNGVTHRIIFLKLFGSVIWNRFILNRKVIIDAPLLFESGEVLTALCSPIIVVCSSEDIQLSRLMARDNVTEEAARGMMKLQWPMEKKCEAADIVIDNNGSLADLEEKIDILARDLSLKKREL